MSYGMVNNFIHMTKMSLMLNVYIYNMHIFSYTAKSFSLAAVFMFIGTYEMPMHV